MARQLTRLEVKHDGAKWIVREQGIGRLTSHESQQDAAHAARAVAAINTPCEVTIHDLEGNLQSEEKFPRR